jgi:hypothetical protein
MKKSSEKSFPKEQIQLCSIIYIPSKANLVFLLRIPDILESPLPICSMAHELIYFNIFKIISIF